MTNVLPRYTMLATALCDLLRVTGASSDIQRFSIGLLTAPLTLMVGLENCHNTM